MTFFIQQRAVAILVPHNSFAKEIHLTADIQR